MPSALVEVGYLSNPREEELLRSREVQSRLAWAIYLLRLTNTLRQDHVFTLHAELEGLRYGETLEALLTGWREQGYDLVSLGQMAASLPPNIPRCEMVRGTVPGRSGTLMLQGEDFLSSWKEAA